ncbi:transposase [Streptomyces phaeochromogenes]|uniref:transposase n=1 Tax=Streptomyces phaeochromogenes TaxID=1923 RepID=UPI0035944878
MPLTDARWARIEPLLPDRTPRRGGQWRDHRQVIDAIAFKFQTGSQWIHLPEKYGRWIPMIRTKRPSRRCPRWPMRCRSRRSCRDGSRPAGHTS